MLVLSRRTNEKIHFPEVGVTIHFLRVQSSTAKVGIDAPMHISIVRGEQQRDSSSIARQQDISRLPRKVRHAIRNELHTVSVGVHLLREQLALNLVGEAEETFLEVQNALRRLDSSDLLGSPNASRPTKEQATSGQRTLLLVEDQANERELLAALLRTKGFDVICAADGNEAIEYLAANATPLAILMDMQLPNCSGATAVHRIRASANHRLANVFAVSGTSPGENGLEVGDDGVNSWFPKPLDPQQLLDALTECAPSC